MFVYFIYELGYSGDLVLSWPFEKALYKARINGDVVISQQKYFDWLREKDEASEETDFSRAMLYKPASSSDLADIRYYELPDYLDKQLVSEQGSRTKAFALMMTESYAPIESWFEGVINEIAGRDTIEAIIQWHPIPSLSQVTKKLGIPHIHEENGPFRVPIYKDSTYLDFVGGIGAKNEAAERYNVFKQELASMTTYVDYVLKPKEVLALLLNNEYMNKLEFYDYKPVFEWGVAASGFTGSVGLAYYNAYMFPEFLEDIKRSIDAKNATLRLNYGNPFTVHDWMWPGVIDKSFDPISFILQCRRVVCVESKISFEAMVWGRYAHMINAPNSVYASCAAQTLSEKDSKLADNEFVSFISFAYFVPLELFCDPEYLRWRLTKPTEIEIYSKHLSYYLAQIGLSLKRFLSIAQEQRYDFIIRQRNFDQMHDQLPYHEAAASKIVNIEVERDCCFKYWISPTRERPHQLIESEKIDDIIDELEKNAGIDVIHIFIKGDQLPHLHFNELLETLNSSSVARRADVTLHASASVLDDGRADALLDIPIISQLNVYIDRAISDENIKEAKNSNYEDMRCIANFATRVRLRMNQINLSVYDSDSEGETAIHKFDGFNALHKAYKPSQPINDCGFSGCIDLPQADVMVSERFVELQGWAHHGSAIKTATASIGYCDPQPVFYGYPRVGIAEVLPELGTENVGFSATLDIGGLRGGEHLLEVSFFTKGGKVFTIKKAVRLL